MRRVRAGETFAVEGLWMTVGEAAAVKRELLARGTRAAERLADAIGFPYVGAWAAGSALGDDAEEAEGCARRGEAAARGVAGEEA